MIAYLIGGVGIFLFGMSLMTEGLKSLGSATLKAILEKFTSNRYNSLLVGFLITVAIQSSSATTLMTLGFVSAEMISFSSALGIVLGSNLGTTVKGWLVSTVGLKIDIAAYALPLVGIASFMNLFGRERLARFGSILAGFAMIFMGIGFMQQGMSEFAAKFSMSFLPSDTFFGRLLLIAIGIAMTVLMQSSSAAVATTLTAVHTGSVNLHQAAALVIGQNIGTTVTAILGAVNGNIHAKRTAVANTFFNLITGGFVILIFPLFTDGFHYISERMGVTDDAVVLSFFHTGFNVFGVLLFLPLTQYFARFIERLMPEKKSGLMVHLDEHKDQLPSIALVSITETLADIGAAAFARVREMISGKVEPHLPEAAEMERALCRVKAVLSHLNNPSADDQKRALEAIHTMDHLQSLVQICRETEKAQLLRDIDSMREIGEKFLNDASVIYDWLTRKSESINVSQLEALSMDLANRRRNARRETFELAASRQIGMEQSLLRIEAIRWLDRTAYHLWRMSFHLSHLRSNSKGGGR